MYQNVLINQLLDIYIYIWLLIDSDTYIEKLTNLLILFNVNTIYPFAFKIEWTQKVKATA